MKLQKKNLGKIETLEIRKHGKQTKYFKVEKYINVQTPEGTEKKTKIKSYKGTNWLIFNLIIDLKNLSMQKYATTTEGTSF